MLLIISLVAVVGKLIKSHRNRLDNDFMEFSTT